MAREIETGEIVALKKIRMDNEREGVCFSAWFFDAFDYCFWSVTTLDDTNRLCIKNRSQDMVTNFPMCVCSSPSQQFVKLKY